MIVPLKQPIMYSIWRKTVSLQFPPLMQMSHFIMSYLISVLLLQTIASRYIQQLNNFHHKYHHLFPPPPQKKKILLRIIDLDNIFRVINRHYSEYTYIQDTLFPHPDNITHVLDQPGFVQWSFMWNWYYFMFYLIHSTGNAQLPVVSNSMRDYAQKQHSEIL